MWVIICEDERVYSRAIENDILCWKESHMYKDVYVQLYHSAEDLLDAFEKGTRCDLLFLDIRMPDGLKGLSWLKSFGNQMKKCKLFSFQILMTIYTKDIR